MDLNVYRASHRTNERLADRQSHSIYAAGDSRRTIDLQVFSPAIWTSMAPGSSLESAIEMLHESSSRRRAVGPKPGWNSPHRLPHRNIFCFYAILPGLERGKNRQNRRKWPPPRTKRCARETDGDSQMTQRAGIAASPRCRCGWYRRQRPNVSVLFGVSSSGR